MGNWKSQIEGQIMKCPTKTSDDMQNTMQKTKD